MQNALYFPHIHVQTDRLMKTALLLWDQVEVITPWPGFPISYHDLGYNAEDTKSLEHAHRLINHEHVPSADEKRNAHDRVLDIATTPNLPKWFLKKKPGDAGFVMYYEKLFDETWKDLEKLGIAATTGYKGEMIVPTAFGRQTMAILAQCCAGNDTQLITDSEWATDEVRQTTEIEQRKRSNLDLAPKEKYFSAVDSLNIVNVDNYTLPQLIEFREKELREKAPHQRVFRNNYWTKLDQAAQEYSVAKNEPERRRVRERFRSELTGEFEFLKEEHGVSTPETLFTVDAASVVTLGAAIATGGALGITAAGVAAGRSVLGKFTGWESKKKAVMQKRPAASYLYVFKNAVKPQNQ